jgi:predicted  nucleic acid-binding Zn-ribbon protein
MTDETQNLVIEILKKIQVDIAGLKFDMVDLKHRVSMIERNTADIASSYAGQSVRIDRLEERLDRIERRLDLSSH